MNKTTAYFQPGQTVVCAALPLYQYDYGQILEISGLDLPATFTVDFGLCNAATTVTVLGEDNAVGIPDAYLLTGQSINAFIYLHTGEDDGETEYRITIAVIPRPRRTQETPTPVEQSLIDQAIAALNAGVTAAEGYADDAALSAQLAASAVAHYPQIIGGVWYVWDAETSAFVSTGVQAQGNDGVSPSVAITNIPNGHRVTITDADHPSGQSFDVMDGEDANLNDVFGVVGSGTYTFTAKQTIHTGIQLTANHSYVIRCETETESLIYAFAHGDTDVYAKMHGRCEVPFLSPLTAELDIHNVRTYIGDVKITVLDAELAEAKLAEVPTVYRVGAHEAYSSFTALCLALKDDDTEKIIELDGGDYDIFQEYVDLGLMDGDPPENPTTGFWDYVVKIPTNTHVIGKGNVRLLWQPTTAQISIPWSKTVGPVCIGGSMTLENVEIRCKNGRYCIHDDTMGKAKYFGSVKRYINVRCYKEENDSGYGFLSCIGFGLDANCSYEFEDCVFSDRSGSAFYMHTRTQDDHDNLYGKVRSPRVLVEDCVIDAGSGENNAVKLGNVDSRQLDIETMFAGCAFQGTFDLRDETTATGNNYNSFDVTLLNCSDVTVVDRYGEANDYPVRVCNWPDLTGYATESWVQQQGYGTYSKPSGGIPKSDLASDVQTSLSKADTALQSVPDTYRAAAAQDVIDAGKADADLGVTGASVGQYVKIKTVDGVGNPTSFEPGTPSGGGADVPLTVVSGKICITYEVST